jgi:hypothetical protein
MMLGSGRRVQLPKAGIRLDKDLVVGKFQRRLKAPSRFVWGHVWRRATPSSPLRLANAPIGALRASIRHFATLGWV